MSKVLPREVAQAVKGSNDTRFYGVGLGDVGKELPRTKSVLCVSFVGGLSPEAPQEMFPGCMFVPGIYLRVDHCCTSVLHRQIHIIILYDANTASSRGDRSKKRGRIGDNILIICTYYFTGGVRTRQGHNIF